MKRILHISKYYYPFQGGTEQTARDCVNALKDLYEQKIICFNNSKEDARDIVDDIDVIRAGSFARISSQSLSFSYGRILNETINSFKPDIVIFHYPNPFVAHYILKFISDNCKLVIYWHLDIVKQRFLKQFFVRQNKLLIRRADKLIATSPTYVEGSPYLSSAREKCVVIPSCIDLKRLEMTVESIKISNEIRLKNADKTVCFAIGRHTKYKGFEYLIKASSLLDKSFRIYIAGTGKETSRLKKIAKNDSKVEFLGSLSDSELNAYYSAMDIFCFSSTTKNEAFGLALAEAMYYGKPAVTFTIPGSGVNYVCLNGENGIEVPNKDVGAYAEAIKRLSCDTDSRIRMGSAGKRRVENYFLFDQFKAALVNALGLL